MKLSLLVEQHKKFESQGLKGGFGDGYLVANNFYYRQVRKAALAAGFRFDSKKNDAYESFPLLCLEQILKDRCLPYSQNVSAFLPLSEAQLAALDSKDLVGNLKKNYVFHEAAHAVARKAVEVSLRNLPSVKDERNFVLQMLVEESCANTCEFLGISEVQDKGHRFFYELNSYMENFESRTQLQKALKDFGPPVLLRWMFVCYLQSNQMRDSISEKEYQRMFEIAFGKKFQDPEVMKMMKSLGRVAFLLSERFRVQTTQFHLRLAGIKTPLEKVLAFDAVAAISSTDWQDFLETWIGLLLATEA